VTLAFLSTHAFANRCDDLAKMKFPHTQIMKVERIESGTFQPEGLPPVPDLPAFCRVVAAIHPAEDSDIHVEVWLPESTWNSRLQGTGNGGLAGKINYGALSGGVKAGFVTANTDMGLSTPKGSDASIFVDRPERFADWGYRATHEMTVLAKLLTQAYYGQSPKRSYFTGCSTGGEQALMEAQRFPEDYDGIVGGAPAHNRTGVHQSILWNFRAMELNPEGYIPPEKLTILSDAVMKSCDAIDGVSDGIIEDPRRCSFNVASLQCKDGDQKDCLTAAQVETAKKIYAGPSNPKTGASLYPGLPFGSEFGWNSFSPAPRAAMNAPYAPVFLWAFGPAWDWKTFNYDTDVVTMNQRLSPALNATSPNLDTFRSLGHKLLIYQGWSDAIVPPGETIHYYESLMARDGVQKKSAPLDNSVKLYMVPGMGHCGSGPGAANFPWWDAMVAWVERGTAPEELTGTRAPKGPAASNTLRPLCPYPQQPPHHMAGQSNISQGKSCSKANSLR
jgi:feruloyl esterase